MTKRGRLWAVGYDQMERAAQVREEIIKLGAQHGLVVLDTAVAVCYPDGIVTLDGERFVCNIKSRAHTFASFIAAIALGVPPLTEAGVGALVRGTRAPSDDATIDEDFVSGVEGLLKPGTSALFVLDQEGDMDALLRGIRGLGGTVLKTTVNVERARLIQSTLTADSTCAIEPGATDASMNLLKNEK
jgi:uncharacterized membrane protein